MCDSPIWIRNRRYFDKSGRPVPRDLFLSNIAQNPWDSHRFSLCVPCGKCPDCLRRLRNSWYIRLERELARCRASKTQAVFITITIHPSLYEKALLDPSSFIRRWLERIRHTFGRSIKHAIFQEFGTHPETGDSPRLHFHGILFDFPFSYNVLRSAVRKFGFVWLSSASLKQARYVVKYVTKDVGADAPYHALGVDPRVYDRKFISPGVGAYLGSRPRPSASVSSWVYTDSRSGIGYSYQIPRYYDRFLSETDRQIRSWRAAFSYLRLHGLDQFIPRVVSCLETRIQKGLASSSVDFHFTKKSELLRRFGLHNRRSSPLLSIFDHFLSPKEVSGILDTWRNFLNINLLWENNPLFLTS